MALSKLLDRAERYILTEALLQDKCICDGHIQQKMKNVFIKISALCSAAVVPPHLVSSVDSAHVGVIVHDGNRAGDRYP